MFRIKAKLRAPSLKYTMYAKHLGDTARDHLSRAMLEYVATFQAIVPVWSGASHGALTQLAQLISAPLVISPSPTSSFFSNGPAYGASRSDASYDDSDGRFTFKFETALPHLVYNEFNNANVSPDPGLKSRLLNPGPYDFIGQTNETVRTVLRQFQPPDLNRFIHRKSVRNV